MRPEKKGIAAVVRIRMLSSFSRPRLGRSFFSRPSSRVCERFLRRLDRVRLELRERESSESEDVASRECFRDLLRPLASDDLEESVIWYQLFEAVRNLID